MSVLMGYTNTISTPWINETAGLNMSKVNLHDANCSSNVSGLEDFRCDKTGNGISLVAPLSMMTLGIMGNIFALVIIYSSRAEAQGRRTVFFVMLSGLAWTDVLAQFCVSPIAILVYINNMVWIGGAHLCRYHGFVMTSFGLITPLIVSCMSVERFLAIRFSYFYASHITQRRAQATFLFCFIAPFVFSSLPFLGFGSYELQYPGSWCFLNFHRESTVDAIYAGIFSCINISAILVMLFCNISVVVTLFIMRQSRMVNKSPSFDRRISVTQLSNGGGAVIRSRKHSDMEAQMIWFLCLITVAFSVCWLPFNVHILGNQFTGNTNHVLDLVFVRMVGCNQILDPWLYVIFRKSSFMRFLGYIKRIFNHKRMPDDELLNEALRNQRRKSLNRSSTMEVTTLNRTIGSGGRGINHNMEDNLECLKKILENERKLGREIMYSHISEKTEYSESLAHNDSITDYTTNQDCQYGSIKSRGLGVDPVEQNGKASRGDWEKTVGNNLKYDITVDTDTLPICSIADKNIHNHRPCTNTRSCPTQGSEPMILHDPAAGSTRQLYPIFRQSSVPATTFSFNEHQDLVQTDRPSPVQESKSFLTLASGHTDDNNYSRSTTPMGRKIHESIKDEEEESNNEVFEFTDQELAMLCPGGGSHRNSSKNLTPRDSDTSKNLTPRDSDSSQNLPECSASDSRGLLS